jgi:inner membrane protein involved in colicin E2 resistance
VRAVISPGPDRSGRRTRLVLSAAFTGVLGAVAVIYGIVTDRTASVVVGTLLLLVTLYTLAVLRRLVRHGGS